ncbi:regulator of ribonuclease activity A [Franzmannia pantelleriensis]|uniref:4-hydroxy-4-methyl-2-oxoglutarate aldolase n=1 Tax=Franzmannia pantelleriensis TaxID=48727 RepID=A0A1G9MBE4_9GAMM|nr:ribonuclease E activity regulator RraA [Halomonas pantelleriensis]SDL71586.1 regulator of ribonuclease activity A [Halomonas pantelleriensis]
MSHIVTPDICDAHPEVQVLDPIFANVGGRETFCGPVRTIKCFEDNALLMQALAEPGNGCVLVVDGGGSLRCALLGDRLAEQALENGWGGVVLYGCVRDVDVLAEMEFGVQALGVHPRRGQCNGDGQRDVGVQFAGANMVPGQWLYADNNGIVIAATRLPLEA